MSLSAEAADQMLSGADRLSEERADAIDALLTEAIEDFYQPKKAPRMSNEFLQAPIDFLNASIETGIISRVTLERLKLMLEEVPELQGSCGVCNREVDHMEADGRFVGTDAIPVVRCANECRGCSECVKPCAEGTCCRSFCSECTELCEGCGQRFCSQHTINDPDCASTWCNECLPKEKRWKLGRQANAELMRA